ncbi:MAG: YceI family protein [Alphaproteobacteria bacterium]|nr:YceI family protein [Alphaproteobacteria bacterium]HPF47981.1 YceI family protein [Emcibacteraceae bacterium]
MNNMKFKIGTLLIFAATSLFSNAALAEWKLDAANSNISYGTIKNDSIGESNTFKTISGSISDSGQINIDIALASVDTQVEVRDGRMRDIVFKVAENASAKLTGNVDLADYQNQKIGSSRVVETSVQLELVGQKIEQDVTLVVTRLGENKVMVIPQGVLFIDADDYELVDSIETLRELAGLETIASVVPMSFYLTFTK